MMALSPTLLAVTHQLQLLNAKSEEEKMTYIYGSLQRLNFLEANDQTQPKSSSSAIITQDRSIGPSSSSLKFLLCEFDWDAPSALLAAEDMWESSALLKSAALFSSSVSTTALETQVDGEGKQQQQQALMLSAEDVRALCQQLINECRRILGYDETRCWRLLRSKNWDLNSVLAQERKKLVTRHKLLSHAQLSSELLCFLPLESQLGLRSVTTSLDETVMTYLEEECFEKLVYIYIGPQPQYASSNVMCGAEAKAAVQEKTSSQATEEYLQGWASSHVIYRDSPGLIGHREEKESQSPQARKIFLAQQSNNRFVSGGSDVEVIYPDFVGFKGVPLLPEIFFKAFTWILDNCDSRGDSPEQQVLACRNKAEQGVFLEKLQIVENFVKGMNLKTARASQWHEHTSKEIVLPFLFGNTLEDLLWQLRVLQCVPESGVRFRKRWVERLKQDDLGTEEDPTSLISRLLNQSPPSLDRVANAVGLKARVKMMRPVETDLDFRKKSPTKASSSDVGLYFALPSVYKVGVLSIFRQQETKASGRRMSLSSPSFKNMSHSIFGAPITPLGRSVADSRSHHDDGNERCAVHVGTIRRSSVREVIALLFQSDPNYTKERRLNEGSPHPQVLLKEVTVAGDLVVSLNKAFKPIVRDKRLEKIITRKKKTVERKRCSTREAGEDGSAESGGGGSLSDTTTSTSSHPSLPSSSEPQESEEENEPPCTQASPDAENSSTTTAGGAFSRTGTTTVSDGGKKFSPTRDVVPGRDESESVKLVAAKAIFQQKIEQQMVVEQQKLDSRKLQGVSGTGIGGDQKSKATDDLLPHHQRLCTTAVMFCSPIYHAGFWSVKLDGPYTIFDPRHFTETFIWAPGLIDSWSSNVKTVSQEAALFGFDGLANVSDLNSEQQRAQNTGFLDISPLWRVKVIESGFYSGGTTGKSSKLLAAPTSSPSAPKPMSFLTTVELPSPCCAIEEIGDGFLSDCTSLTAINLDALWFDSELVPSSLPVTKNAPDGDDYNDVDDGNERSTSSKSTSNSHHHDNKAKTYEASLNPLERLQRRIIHQNTTTDSSHRDGGSCSSWTGVKKLGSDFLRNCGQLLSVDLRFLESVEDWNTSGFLAGCKSLQHVDLSFVNPTSCKGGSGGGGKASGCNEPSSASEQKNKIAIGNNFLQDCQSLKGITLEKFFLVEAIGSDVLSGCKGLEYIQLAEEGFIGGATTSCRGSGEEDYAPSGGGGGGLLEIGPGFGGWTGVKVFNFAALQPPQPAKSSSKDVKTPDVGTSRNHTNSHSHVDPMCNTIASRSLARFDSLDSKDASKKNMGGINSNFFFSNSALVSLEGLHLLGHSFKNQSLGFGCLSGLTLLTHMDFSDPVAWGGRGREKKVRGDGLDDAATTASPITRCHTGPLLTVGDSVFSGCVSLTSVDLRGWTEVTAIGSKFLAQCPQLRMVNCSGLVKLRHIGSSFLEETPSLHFLDLSKLDSLIEGVLPPVEGGGRGNVDVTNGSAGRQQLAPPTHTTATNSSSALSPSSSPSPCSLKQQLKHISTLILPSHVEWMLEMEEKLWTAGNDETQV